MYYTVTTRTLKILKSKLRTNVFLSRKCHSAHPPWKVLFFGTDSFSLISLKHLCSEYRKGNMLKYLGVVTSSIKANPVRQYASNEDLPIYSWPIVTLREEFDVGLVVSFGHLIPEEIIQRFPLGMLNVHASLLPRWRGAAPIIYAIANGDTVTGISIMKIQPKKFDVGEILSQVSVDLPPDMKMPTLRDRLAETGAKELEKCLHNLPLMLQHAIPQSSEHVTYAPKISPEFAVINWMNMPAKRIYNLGRALDTIYPLQTTWQNIPVKLFGIEEYKGTITYNTSKSLINSDITPGFIEYSRSDRTLIVKCCDGNYISVAKVGVLQKKIISASDFNNGYMKKVGINERYLR